MKELPATLLLRPLGLKTLAIEVWELTSESMWADAAIPALAIVADCMGDTAWLVSQPVPAASLGDAVLDVSSGMLPE